MKKDFIKVYTENGERFRLTASIEYDGEIHATGEIVRLARNGRKVFQSCGCLHEEIVKHFPELKPFVKLHNCDYWGCPDYTVKNGFYFAQKYNVEDFARLYNVTEKQAEILKAAPDEKYFKYALATSGVLTNWELQAFKAINTLEEWTGIKAVPTDLEDKNFEGISESEFEEILNLIQSGYYEPEAIQKRKENEKAEKLDKERKELCNRFDKKVSDLQFEKALYLSVFDFGLSVKNVIFYEHTKTLCFNWCDCEDFVSEDKIEAFKSYARTLPIFSGINISSKSHK